MLEREKRAQPLLFRERAARGGGVGCLGEGEV